jgi:hypothetical protein
MTAWVEMHDYLYPGGWRDDASKRARDACEQLEANRVLYFPRTPFALGEPDREFLTAQHSANSAVHKNVSYRPTEDKLRGFDGPAEVKAKLREILRRYSHNVTGFVRELLAPYEGNFALDFASFRPIEEQGRELPLHKRNDLLHVDAFPSRPTHGGRILRVFTNLHHSKMRVWNIGEDFPQLASQLAAGAGLDRIAANGGSYLFTRALQTLGAVPDRSPYDRFMLRFHDFLKENSDYQAKSRKTRMAFPPGSTWLVYTDGVPHAVLSGQHALEQTFIISRKGLVSPQISPISILEKLCGRPLAKRS